MKYKNTQDKYLQEMNKIADQADLYSTDPKYRIIPQGNNNLTTKILYYQRLNYESEFNNVNLMNGVIPENFKDYLYSHQLYGKLNLNNDIINIDENKLKSLDADQKLMLVSPAADAFNALYSRHKRLIDSNVISSKSKFYNIKPKKAFISANLQHSEYINVYFNKFYDFINNNNLNNKIINFKTFIKYFIFFYNQSDKIFNKTEFMRTTACSPYCSGLVVEISPDKHGDDKKSYENYLIDESFGIFDTLSKQHGFVMDKHSPWRLTFDIAGANAKQYLQPYDTQELNSYFDQFYYFTEYFNFESLKIYLLNLFNFIVQEQPIARSVETSFKNGKACIYEKQILREFIRYEDLYNQMPEENLLKLYFYIKVKENNIISSDSQFEQMFSEILTINRYNGNIAVFDFINNKCKSARDTGDIKYTRTFL
jgi:hypothetical protein